MQFLADIPRETIEGDTFPAYKFSGMTQQLETIHTKQLFKAIDRWHGALEGVTSDLQKVIPTEWKEKALN